MLKWLKRGLILFLLIEFACAKVPDRGQGTLFSAFFRLSGNISGQKIHSLRLFVNTDGEELFSAGILLPTNTLVYSGFFDGKRFIVVDYRRGIAYIDNKKPFNLKRLFGVDIDLRYFTGFFNNCFIKGKCRVNKYGNLRFIVNGKNEIVILGDFGNILLVPMGKIRKGEVKKIAPVIPEGYEVRYENF